METNLRYRLTLKKRKYVQVLREAIAERNLDLAYQAACILRSYDAFPTMHGKDLLFDWIYDKCR